MTWEDTRATELLSAIQSRISAERVCLLSGSPLHAGFAAGLARWLTQREPDSIARSRWLVQPKDWLRFRLTGEVASEPSDASGTLLFDVTDCIWSAELLEAFGIPSTLLPPIVPSASVAGGLMPSVADEFGLSRDIPVVAGGGDAPATALAAGIRASLRGSRALLSFGTAAQIAVAAERTPLDPQCSCQRHRHVIAGEWLMVAAIPSAGSSIAWLARLVLPDLELEAAIDQLVVEAGSVPPGARGVIFIPQLLGRRSPEVDPVVSGAFVGLRIQHGRPEMARAVLEGVGFALRDGLDALRARGFQPTALTLVGGAGDATVWPQILASILEVEIRRSREVDGAAFGAAMLAAEGGAIALASSPRRPALEEVMEPKPTEVAALNTIHSSRWAEAVAALNEVPPL